MNTRLKLTVVLVLWFVAFIPIYPELVGAWLNHSNNSHGILVPFISLYFIWEKRGKLKSAKISNSNWAGAVLILSMVLYLLSYAGNVAIVSRSMIVLSLIAIILFTLGKTLFTILAFPILFLFFMVPVPDSILGFVSFPLQLFATKVSAFVIQALSIPVHREGNMIYFAGTQLEIAEACSGIRSIMSLTMLSLPFAYAYIWKGKWVHRAILIGSAVPLALFVNIVRVSGTGVLADFWGDKVARSFLHEFSGLAVFAFGFTLLFLEYSFLTKLSSQATQASNKPNEPQ